jgi:uncharacterized protein (TIGR00369 family)
MKRATQAGAIAPQLEARVRESFARQGFMRHLGANIAELRSGSCAIRVPFQDELTQQHGFFHGAVIGAIADVACGYAAYTKVLHRSPTSTVLTVEYKLNFLAPAVGDYLEARARVIRSGKTLTVCRADVFCGKDGKEKICATMLETVMTMPDSPERT